MKFQRHLDGFRDYLRTHHVAARTIETYGANTKRFLAFLEQRYPRIDTVEAWSPRTRSSTINGIWPSMRIRASGR